MATTPKISIITISYNSEATISKTIESILSQNYPNTEYVIIDGGSTDSTIEIVSKYTGISKVISEPDKGISDAFNKGIFNSTGELIVFINSDDELLPGALSKVAEQYCGQADIYCCNVVMRDIETGFSCREKPSTDFPIMPFFRHCAHQGMFATRSCYEKYGTYDTNIRWPMDLEFLMRAYRMGAKWKYLDIDAAIFNSGGVTYSVPIYKKKNDYLYIVRKNGGNTIQGWIFFLSIVSTNVIKKFLNSFGKNLGQRLRYKRTLQHQK